jgi:ABC-type transporter Mla MlaB component
MEDIFTIMLDPMITLSSIEPLYALCKEAALAPAVIVNASQVERLCTPAFQLLISLKNTIEPHNKTFEIQQPSEAFCMMLAILGLETITQKNEVQS